MMKKTLATLCLMLITLSLSAQDITREWVERYYTKREVMIPMRDGVKLFTAIYEPINAGKLTPIMMSRTPYQASPYGEGYSSTSGESCATMCVRGTSSCCKMYADAG